MRRKESIRQIGDVTIKRNDQLGYTHYKVGRGESVPPVEIYVSDEMRKHADVSFKRLKQLASEELERISADPYGETSIDPNVTDPEARNKRTINRVTDEVEAEIGFPVAIKISHASPESLVGQYKLMRDLQKAAERRLSNLTQVVGFLPVYGAVKVGQKQFLIMEHVKEAKEIEDKVVTYAPHGWSTPSDPAKELAFSAKEHPELIAALNIEQDDPLVRWRSISGELGHILGKQLGDIAGRNVLHRQDEQGNRYFIIDQVPQGTYI